jgi:hypothetical protein
MQKPYSLHGRARNLARVLTLPMKVTDVANFNRSESIGWVRRGNAAVTPAGSAKTKESFQQTCEPPSASRWSERWVQATREGPVPADAPAVKRPRARLPETRTLKTTPAVVRHRLRFHTISASQHAPARILRKDRGRYGGGNNNRAQDFEASHQVFSVLSREKPVLGRSFRAFKRT